MTQKALCIMAAGLGTRFGSLKQLHPIVDTFAIIDFSIYDALKAGFNEIILIIRKETQKQFEIHFSNFDNSRARITYVHQNSVAKINNKIIKDREKPWGTGHALLCLEPNVSNNFALINADDYYGRDAFKTMFNALYNYDSTSNYLIGYDIKKTLSKNGSVSRGECIMDNQNNLNKIIERLNLRIKNKEILYDKDTSISNNTIVSMNFWGFTPSIFTVAEYAFRKFLKQSDNLKTDEFYITNVVDESINQNNQTFKVLKSNTQWYGITYQEDTTDIKEYLITLIGTNFYPKQLCNTIS